MKRILFNARQSEELRVAIVDGQYLFDLDIESLTRNQKKGNIYRGIVRRVEPSLEAAFVDYGGVRHGFLPLKEVSAAYLQAQADDGGKGGIRSFREGQEVTVQVEKEERGTKGAALTTHISLAGRYLVLMPYSPDAGGVSRKIEGDDRVELKDLLGQLQVPKGMGVIARTVAAERNLAELQWDLDHLVELWNAIDAASTGKPVPFLIYQENNVVARVIRDYFRDDIGELLIDDEATFEEAQALMQQLMPQSASRLKLYQDKVPLFTRYQIEHQIETAHRREVPLRSGGALVIDHTEALTAIDINSARATQGSDIEETATNTNLEACDEIARQLRLRDLGGLIVIDFIDMMKAGNQRAVEERLRDAVKHDRARIQLGKLSRFGLLEMSRQRLRPSLKETSHITCPRCEGQGTIRSVESTALHVLRLLEEEALKERTGRLAVQVPVAVATYLLNEKRDAVAELGERLGVNPIILPNPALETPHYELERTRVQDLNKRLLETPSHELALTVPPADVAAAPAAPLGQPAAAVQRMARSAPPPVQQPEVEPATPQVGLFVRLWRALAGNGAPAQATVKPKPKAKPAAARTPGEREKRAEPAGRGHSRRGAGGAQRKQAAAESRDGQQRARGESPAQPAAANETPRESREPSEPREGREGREGRSSRRGRRGGRGQKSAGGGDRQPDRQSERQPGGTERQQGAAAARRDGAADAAEQNGKQKAAARAESVERAPEPVAARESELAAPAPKWVAAPPIASMVERKAPAPATEPAMVVEMPRQETAPAPEAAPVAVEPASAPTPTPPPPVKPVGGFVQVETAPPSASDSGTGTA
ncbi:Rne/Rng family ribonuclease [Immundisolibacter sp.]|uniref:Rne/Rng family ribonuclease n=1 Tax=Immundisolibacter sp. TaxID=1934948 RepID=UPI003F876626